jgi:hypothetical protein
VPEPRRTDYDSPWKEALALFLPDFLALLFPHIHGDIDWSAGYRILDQELRKIVPASEAPDSRVDLLAEVRRRSGDLALVYLHVVVQSEPDDDFPLRHFRYSYRLFDRYGPRVSSVVVLADENPAWRPNRYEHELWGARLGTEFPTLKLLDLDLEVLRNGPQRSNPFAVVVRAHRTAQMTRPSLEGRYRGKLGLIRELLRTGRPDDEVWQLLRLIDWFLTLPSGLEQELRAEVVAEEGERMPYVTSWERMAKEEGRQETAQGFVLDALSERFGPPPVDLVTAVRAIKDQERLRSLFRSILALKSVDEFRRLLDA